MDGAYGRDGEPDREHTSWVTDNAFVAELAEAHLQFLFGASVHPCRRDAVGELCKWIDRGACLVKWIPSAQRIRLDDPICIPFYEALAAHGVPLLVHTGNEHASSRSLNDWNDPALLRYPLERGVTVIAAHCGARMFLYEKCYFPTFTRMALEHDNLYGDLSAFGIPTRIGVLRKVQKDPNLLAKVIYGSDFPAFAMVRWFWLSIGSQGVREILAEANPLEKPYLLMRKMGLPDEVFSRAEGLLRLPVSARGEA
jgi:predicted TIM-barrel fold metal-dependent hydrolase